ncbi:maleylpyruvate isomerase N-terminal domain-containing protein, partial [Plantactinospora sp. S1510]
MTATSTWTILDRAHTALRDATAPLTAADLGRATPCSDWNVAQVLQHSAGDQLAFASAITGQGGPTENPFTPSGHLAGTPAELVEPALSASAAAFATV